MNIKTQWEKSASECLAVMAEGHNALLVAEDGTLFSHRLTTQDDVTGFVCWKNDLRTNYPLANVASRHVAPWCLRCHR